MREFEAHSRKVRIIEDYPYKEKYRGSDSLTVGKKYINVGISTIVIGDKVFCEAGRVSRKVV